MQQTSAVQQNRVETIIKKFGSQQRVAELLGIWQTAVSGWVRRGAIPAKRQEELLTIARREGIDLSPVEFFESLATATATATGTDLPRRDGRPVTGRRERRRDGVVACPVDGPDRRFAPARTSLR
jgi:predicted XRE-type DNA-binding protein